MAGLSPTQRNAYLALQSILNSYGLGDMANLILQYVQQGYDQNTAFLLLQQSPEWQQRFAGNATRQKNGLPVLDPATYLDLENQYQSILRSGGIPQGMFNRADFANWIGGDVSPSEIQSRVNLAQNAVYTADPYFKEALALTHGVDFGHLTAYFLDSQRALPFLQQQSQAATIGAEALRNHLQYDQNTALTLASLGVTQQQAQQGYSTIGQELPSLSQLAAIHLQQPFTQQTAEQATFMGQAPALRQEQNIASYEKASFGGSSGVGNSSINPSYGLTPELEGAF